jgi:hypothetical protein
MILFIPNDLGLPTFLQRPRSALLGSRSLVLSRFAHFFTRGMRAEEGDVWWETPSLKDQHGVAGGAEPQVPPEYAHLVGIAGYRRALRSIAETARAAGVPVVNVADYAGHGVDWPAVEREQEVMGIVHLSPQLSWSSPALWLKAHDPHLAPHAAAELARRVAAGVRTRGVCLPPP